MLSPVPATQTRHLAPGEAGLDLRAQLKPDEVFDVVENALAFLHSTPAREEEALMHKEGLAGRLSRLVCC